MGMDNVTIKAILKQYLPNPIQHKIFAARESIRRKVNSQRYLGTHRYCPICISELSTYQINDGIAVCPVCDSSERHRVDWLFFNRNTDLFDESPKKILHVAPEYFLTKRFSEFRNIEYVSIDIEDPRAMLKMDLTDILYPDDYFDVVYCSRVLEYIEDDKKAISEMLRVIRPGGWGLLQVSVAGKNTFEDPTIVTPEERFRAYGDKGHKRLSGVDYIERIQACGWDAELFCANDFISNHEFEKLGILMRDRYVFYCRKPY